MHSTGNSFLFLYFDPIYPTSGPARVYCTYKGHYIRKVAPARGIAWGSCTLQRRNSPFDRDEENSVLQNLTVNTVVILRKCEGSAELVNTSLVTLGHMFRQQFR
jgi:hypothetical protein